MTLQREKLRELIFQVLYSQDFLKGTSEETISFFMDQLKTTKKNVCFALQKTEEILQNLSSIDGFIQEKSENYSFERVSRVEKNILRICLFELLFEKNLSSSIVISEGIRLCKKFGTDESAKFVHAIIDEVQKEQLSHA